MYHLRPLVVLYAFTYIPLRTFALLSLDIIRPTFKGVFDHMVGAHMRPRTTDTQWRHKPKKYEKFGPDGADKYASTKAEYLGLGCDSRPCTAGHSLIMHPSSVHEAIWLNYALIYTKIPLPPLQSLARQSLFYGRIGNSTITQSSCIFVELNCKEFLV